MRNCLYLYLFTPMSSDFLFSFCSFFHTSFYQTNKQSSFPSSWFCFIVVFVLFYLRLVDESRLPSDLFCFVLFCFFRFSFLFCPFVCLFKEGKGREGERGRNKTDHPKTKKKTRYLGEFPEKIFK